MEAEVTPTEVEESSDILALSTPSTVPSFAPPAPAKVSTPSGATGSSVKMGAAPDRWAELVENGPANPRSSDFRKKWAGSSKAPCTTSS